MRKAKSSSGDTRGEQPYKVEYEKVHGKTNWITWRINRATKSPYSKIVSITIIEKTI
jgi:hypothetical protein